MAQYIEKDKIEEILRCLWKQDDGSNPEHRICYNKALQEIQCKLDTIETIDPYEQCVQYPSIEDGIKAHAETYSFNIESELFNQLTKEQQKLWRKEIEQACISGGNAGVEIARDVRYKENIETKEVDLEKATMNYLLNEHISSLNVVLHHADLKLEMQYHKDIEDAYKAGFELGIKTKKGE